MTRLFVALELPAAATAELARIQPVPLAGLRLAESGQMHLTLHYLGEADVERMAAALGAVAVPPFPLVIEGVGQFPSAGGAVTLWVGVRKSAELLRLCATVAAALAREGFQPEARAWAPHVTVARCESKVSAEVVDAFLARNEGFALPAVPVTEYGLYSSAFVGDVPVYQRVQSFPLRVVRSRGEGLA
jgi:RNA 2',3'-cyclic 3'-phosphodiesterase